jgi:hypothetical protein
VDERPDPTPERITVGPRKITGCFPELQPLWTPAQEREYRDECSTDTDDVK